MKRFVALAAAAAVLVVVSSAYGAKPTAGVKPNKLNFGSHAALTTSTLTVTVTNTTSVTEMVAGVHVMTGDEADFAVEGSSSCVFPMPVVLVPGASCFANVDFNPQGTGTFKATLQIDLNPGPFADVSLSGRGT